MLQEFNFPSPGDQPWTNSDWGKGNTTCCNRTVKAEETSRKYNAKSKKALTFLLHTGIKGLADTRVKDSSVLFANTKSVHFSKGKDGFPH